MATNLCFTEEDLLLKAQITDEAFKVLAELEEKELLHCFEKNKERARKEGWTVKAGTFVLAPAGHESRNWTATWYTANTGEIVPCYFKRFFN